MSRMGNIMAVIFAYTAIIFLISLVLGPYNPITDRLAVGTEVKLILSGGKYFVSEAESTALELNAPIVGTSEVNGTTVSIWEQAWNLVSGLVTSTIASVLPEEVKSALMAFAQFFVLVGAIVSLLWKLAVGGVAILATGIAANSVTDVILGIFLLPMTLAVIRALIEGIAYLLEHIPVIGRGGGD